MISSLIAFVVRVYILLIVVDAVLSFFPQFRMRSWYRVVRESAEFTEGPVRRYLPRDLPLDISPIVVIILLNIFLIFW